MTTDNKALAERLEDRLRGLWSYVQEARTTYAGDHSSGTFRRIGERIESILDTLTREPSTPSARPPKPKECLDACPPQQVCDHCQWPPATSDATPSAQVSGGGDDLRQKAGKASEFAWDCEVVPLSCALDALSTPQARPDESLRDWSLRMAEAEAGQEVRAGSFGIPDEQARPDGGEVVAWRVYWSPAFPRQFELTADRERIEKIRALAEPPRIEPLTHPTPAPDVARLVEADVAFTTDEVREAWKCLRTHNHSIPDECLDQMRDVLLTAAQQERGHE